MSPLSSTITFIAAAGLAGRPADRPAQWRGRILIGRELHPVIGQVASAHGTKCIKEDGRDSLHQLYYGTGPATMPSGMLLRSLASRRGRSQEGLCCPERTPRLLTSTAGENGGRQTADGDKKAHAEQRATQGRHLHGYQGCRQVQQERMADGRRRTATRRLMLRRDLLKDAIYMATKAVDKYSRRERRTADGGRQTADENGDKKARAAQRAA